MSWSALSEAQKTWSAQTGDAAKTWTRTLSHTTGRNSSRFIRMDGRSDGTGGIDFIFRVQTANDDYRFFIESSAPISLRSTHNNPLSPA